MKKYQVFKFEKDYVGVYYFEDLKPATEMFTIFTEEAIRERERDIKITEKICLCEHGKMISSWEE